MPKRSENGGSCMRLRCAGSRQIACILYYTSYNTNQMNLLLLSTLTAFVLKRDYSVRLLFNFLVKAVRT